MYPFHQLFVHAKILGKCNIYELLLIGLRVVQLSVIIQFFKARLSQS